jgi:hypothetical protein
MAQMGQQVQGDQGPRGVNHGIDQGGGARVNQPRVGHQEEIPHQQVVDEVQQQGNLIPVLEEMEETNTV